MDNKEELKQKARELYSMVYEVECFGAHDVLELEQTLNKLEELGVEFEEKKKLVFIDQEE